MICTRTSCFTRLIMAGVTMDMPVLLCKVTPVILHGFFIPRPSYTGLYPQSPATNIPSQLTGVLRS